MKIVIVALLLACLYAQEKVLYLHNGGNVPSMDFSTIKNSPVYVPIDCRKSDCSRYKASEYPALIYWKGPGSNFEHIYPVSFQSALEYLKAKQIGMVNQFKIFLEDLSLFSTFILAFVVASFLYTIFTLLFSPRQSQLVPGTKKNKGE